MGRAVGNRAQGGLMYFDTFAEFLQMGKHGFYVWLAYGATALVLLWSWISARATLSGIEKQLAEQREISARSTSQKSALELSETGASGEP